MSRDWSGRKIHFIGAGGAGMSGLALACVELGASVSGSDRSDSSYLERIARAGARIAVGHEEANLPAGADVVVSTAIPEDNPELVAARSEGRTVLHRSDLLAELCAGREVLAVAGTHGKTTTTGMLTWALRALGRDPAFFVGGEVRGLGPGGEPVNSGWSDDGPIVVEADESDGSFLKLDPTVAVVMNVEMDHHSNWDGMESLRRAFGSFVARAGEVVLPEEDRDCAGPLAEGTTVVTYSFSSPGPEKLELLVPGRHNVLDARAALAALAAFGFDAGELDRAADALADFPGARRRLEYVGEVGGARIYDDYAHHPTEVRASIEALREIGDDRLLVVFQPHLYSRTLALAPEFGAALAMADGAVVLDVYPAREIPEGPLEGVSGLDVARATADRSGGRPLWWAPELDSAERVIRAELGAGTTVVTMGAGDVTSLSTRLMGSDR